MEKSIDERIQEETAARLQIMGSRDYTFPRKADKADVLGIIAAISICLLLIMLCMTGVLL